MLAASMTATGISADDVAAQVIGAIRRGDFYILSNPEWSEAVRERGERIADGGPVAAPPNPS